MKNGRRVQGCKGAKKCNRGALHPGDGAETKGAMHCTPYGVPVRLHPYVSLSHPIPDELVARPISEVLALDLPPTCARLTADRDVCLRRVRADGDVCWQHAR